MGTGKHIASNTFKVGGYQRAVCFYSKGKNLQYNIAYVPVYVELASKGMDVRALPNLCLWTRAGRGSTRCKATLTGIWRVKEKWADELPAVLWAYRTTPSTSTGETPFALTYSYETVLPIELDHPTHRVQLAPRSQRQPATGLAGLGRGSSKI
ncbi:hypothetical protein HPP92_026980 [Vanilla planifolia]|uniref:Uncharacterized protein n=1 Tax=Vanilla planifolia TaxID=51239 RepID=A0A835U6T5_VANPL|nr:hypothetical protein HPP92_027124 [Vanilla planifolia]KAG0450010.1 hypothetical protein HPP92_026980 [Vanilla planifolia]